MMRVSIDSAFDARVEHAQTAGLPDPRLAGCQTRTSFFPRDRCARNFCGRRANCGPLDGAGVTRVPGSVQPYILLFGKIDERQHLADRNARRFFQENVPSAFQGVAGEFVAHLRRRATAHRFNLGTACSSAARSPKLGVPSS